MKNLTIGSRGSLLAIWQAKHIKQKLEQSNPNLICEIKIINTKGDLVLNKSLGEIGGKGLFTKELENALLENEIDIAVHSLKDLQTEMPEGLILACVPSRGRTEDVLIAKPGITLNNLINGAKIATGSVRRKSQLLAIRPDFNIVDVRGNVPTRIQKYKDNNWDGMILALAGLERLGITENIGEVIPVDVMIPAVAQGALGIQSLENNIEVIDLLKSIEDENTRLCVNCEREFLRTLGGGCHTPVAANAIILNDEIIVNGYSANEDGSNSRKGFLIGNKIQNVNLGKKLALSLS